MKSYNTMFLSSMGVSFLVSVSASSWFVVWVGIEVGVFSFLPVLISGSLLVNIEAGIEYFLVQSFGGLVLLYGVLVSVEWVMCSGLIIKLGGFPFYHWVPNICAKVSWSMVFLLLVWQKIVPLLMLCSFVGSCYFWCVGMSSVGCAVVGALGGYMQGDFRSLMGYSSLVHLGWMLACSMVSMELVVFYLFVYSLGLGFVVSVFSVLDAERFGGIYKREGRVMWMGGLVILSLWGFPPLVGFVPKYLAVVALLDVGAYLHVIVLLMSSWVSLAYYCSLVWALVSQSSGEVKDVEGGDKISVVVSLLFNLGVFLVLISPIMLFSGLGLI